MEAFNRITINGMTTLLFYQPGRFCCGCALWNVFSNTKQDAYNAPSPDDVIWENVTVPATQVRTLL